MEEYSPEFMGVVRLQMALMGLTLAFKEKHGEEVFETTKAYVESMGMMIGSQIVEKADIAGSGTSEIGKVFQAWLGPAYAPRKPDIKVENKTVIVTRESPALCPAMVTSKQMKQPLDLVCETVGIPMFRGVAKAVNKEAVHTSIRNPQKCLDKIEIP